MSERHQAALLDRRKLVLGAAGVVASAGAAKSLAWPSASGAAALPSRRGVLPAPNPIPGGLEVAPGLVIHVFLPGDPSVTLPFSGLPLGGFDVEPCTITDFNGSSAVAFHVGTAEGSDGKTYNLETDIRAFEGEYVADGSVHRGAFALI
jgi:hypothetical protein